MYSGFAIKCITPGVGVPMSGGYHPRFSTGVTDDIHTRAIAFFDGERRALLIAVDVCYMATEIFDECRERISGEFDMDKDAIIITCSHTHTGPHVANCKWKFDFDIAGYIEFLKDSICAAAREAFADLSEAKLYTACGMARGISFIRRYRMKDGSVVTNPGIRNPEIDHPLGEPNEEVKLIKIERPGTSDIYLVNFGTHACMVSGKGISADYPGVLCARMEREFPGSHCMFVVSAEGDTNHINVNPSDEWLEMAYRDHDSMGATKLRAERVANTIVDEVLRICKDMKTAVSDKINYGKQLMKVPANKKPTDAGELDESKRILAIHDSGRTAELPYTGMALNTVLANARRVVRMQDMPDFFDYSLYAISVGGIAFVGLPGEPFTEIGNRVCEASPFDFTVLCALTNCMTTYFPSTRALNEGGYEALTSNVGIGTDDIIVNSAAQLYKRISN